MSSIRERIEGLARIYPRLGPTRYLYASKGDLRRKGEHIVLLMLMHAQDGRWSVHSTDFTKTPAKTVRQWAGWLEDNAPGILRNQVISHVNRSFGSIWSIDRIVGWHFMAEDE